VMTSHWRTAIRFVSRSMGLGRWKILSRSFSHNGF
jgi:hypothetical protein